MKERKRIKRRQREIWIYLGMKKIEKKRDNMMESLIRIFNINEHKRDNTELCSVIAEAKVYSFYFIWHYNFYTRKKF